MMVAAPAPDTPVLGGAALVCGELVLGAAVVLPLHPAAIAAIASGTARIDLRMTARPSVCVRDSGISCPLASMPSGAKRGIGPALS